MSHVCIIIHLHNYESVDMISTSMVVAPKRADQAPSCTTEEHTAIGRKPLTDMAALERAARLFRAIGDPSRLRILSRLAQGEMCVTELAVCEQESLPTISQRLRILRAENLITRRRRGKHINYALADQHVMDLVFNALAHATERPAAIPAEQIHFEKEKTT
jgi:ArsR family transcriptional regulator, lead/cadmium/zinc/bismuth-responsive transcriptional repressor